jgi:carbamoyl-phosphate synthase small subunit
VGCVVREDVTAPSNSAPRAILWLDEGQDRHRRIDTRALTRRIRLAGAPNAVIAHERGKFDLPALLAKAQEWLGLEGMDLAKIVSRAEDWEGAASGPGLWPQPA